MRTGFRSFLRRRWVLGACAGVVGATGLIWGARVLIERNAPYIHVNAAEVPQRRVALVLGCVPLLADGRANLFFQHRMRAAADLFNAGRVDYLLVSGDNHRAGYDEPTAMRDALVARGVPAEAVEVIACGPSMDHAREVCGRYFREHPAEARAAALIALNDVAAIGAMRAALDAGLAVPGDLSIVGVDDIPLCEFLPVPLASIRQRYRKIGAEAIELLVSRIEGRAEAGELPRQSVFPTHFIARASVAAAPAFPAG